MKTIYSRQEAIEILRNFYTVNRKPKPDFNTFSNGDLKEELYSIEHIIDDHLNNVKVVDNDDYGYECDQCMDDEKED